MIEVPLDPIFSAFGLDATVTVEGEDPVETTVVWIKPETPEQPVGGTDQRGYNRTVATRREQKRCLVVRRDDVPAMPRGTQIVAPERYGAENKTWIVDGDAHREADHIRAYVIPARR